MGSRQRARRRQGIAFAWHDPDRARRSRKLGLARVCRARGRGRRAFERRPPGARARAPARRVLLSRPAAPRQRGRRARARRLRAGSSWPPHLRQLQRHARPIAGEQTPMARRSSRAEPRWRGARERRALVAPARGRDAPSRSGGALGASALETLRRGLSSTARARKRAALARPPARIPAPGGAR